MPMHVPHTINAYNSESEKNILTQNRKISEMSEIRMKEQDGNV